MHSVTHRLRELSSRLDRGDLDTSGYLAEFCRVVVEGVGCDRASVWLFGHGGGRRRLRCLAMYDRPQDRMVEVEDMVDGEVGAYFDHLLRDGTVVATHAREHPSTVAFLDDYLRPHDVHSVLDACVSINGQVVGTFCCEQTGAPRSWSPQQIEALKALSRRGSLPLLKALRAALDKATEPWHDASSPLRLITQIQTFDGP
jgi:GAF domain-containing protein